MISSSKLLMRNWSCITEYHVIATHTLSSDFKSISNCTEMREMHIISNIHGWKHIKISNFIPDWIIRFWEIRCDIFIMISFIVIRPIFNIIFYNLLDLYNLDISLTKLRNKQYVSRKLWVHMSCTLTSELVLFDLSVCPLPFSV